MMWTVVLSRLLVVVVSVAMVECDEPKRAIATLHWWPTHQDYNDATKACGGGTTDWIATAMDIVTVHQTPILEPPPPDSLRRRLQCGPFCRYPADKKAKPPQGFFIGPSVSAWTSGM
jgi:hypothetical protein